MRRWPRAARCGSTSSGADRDRYGRLVAFAFAGDAKQSLQQTLLEQGQARVSARVGDKACADALLAAERQARAARRGLWADPNFAPLPAESSTRLRDERGHFALVEGKVLSVHESGGTIYVNFGRRWTRDFSVIILRRNERSFAAAGIEPKQLEGRRVRVRGWLEQRRGPIIEADAPEQIELVGAAAAIARRGAMMAAGGRAARWMRGRRRSRSRCCSPAAPACRTTARSRCNCRS